MSQSTFNFVSELFWLKNSGLCLWCWFGGWPGIARMKGKLFSCQSSLTHPKNCEHTADRKNTKGKSIHFEGFKGHLMHLCTMFHTKDIFLVRKAFYSTYFFCCCCQQTDFHAVFKVQCYKQPRRVLCADQRSIPAFVVMGLLTTENVLIMPQIDFMWCQNIVLPWLSLPHLSGKSVLTSSDKVTRTSEVCH